MNKHILVNLKRFDIPLEYGGVNNIAPIEHWGEEISKQISNEIISYENVGKFSVFFPESHLLNASSVANKTKKFAIGCQGVAREDVGENFGAFTTLRPATVVKAMGVTEALIGHYEERRNLKQILAEHDKIELVNKLLNEEMLAAQAAGLKLVYCIGEMEDEQDNWQEIIKLQLKYGLENINLDNVVIAYEPVWAIGPGKTPPERVYIQKIADYIKSLLGKEVPVVYGGGMKKENAQMIASIKSLDGALIALTRFQGEIGFYPEEFGVIIKKYFEELEK